MQADDSITQGNARVQMSSRKKYDVFLSHDSRDKAIVEKLAARLSDEAGIRPFFDAWDLVPGVRWQPSIERALKQSRTCAVLVGANGIGPWEDAELRTALEIHARQ
ncbi:MAG TPA: toll/interleukin-1 receptor domain-containing protein, partial [Longimicrobium sp.]